VAVNLVMLHVLYGIAHLPILVASGLAVESAVIHNYLLNDHWTYRQSRPSLGRFVRFNLSTLVTLLMNVIVVWGLVSSGFDYLWANLVGIGCGGALNFGASSAWVWRGSFR
jgi:putative flippase GtrA